jgi:hypothetical protein
MYPPIFEELLSEGRTQPKLAKLLAKCLSPDQDGDVPIHIYLMSQDLVREFKDMRFGCG